MSYINQSQTIKKRKELEDGSVYLEHSNGVISLESPVTYFFPEYNRHMSVTEFEYMEKKKLNDKLPLKLKEKVKKL